MQLSPVTIPTAEPTKMSKLTLFTVSLMTLSWLQAAMAVPTTSEKPFSFAEWVEGMIANPNDQHLTAEEAIAAWYTSAPLRNAVDLARPHILSSLEHPATCNEVDKIVAPVRLLFDPVSLFPLSP